jgi:hypothetical protein
MATSGSIDFTFTAGQIIEKAFSKIGVKSAEQALQPAELQDGLDALNLMLKSMQSQGLHLWTREEGVLFLDAGKTDYLVGPSGDEATTLDDFIGTTTTTALAALDVIVPVASTTGMTTGDTAGMQLDDGTRQWTTITVDSATQVTLAVGVTSAASSGNTLFTYTNIIERPLRITSFRRKTFNADNEIPVNQWSRDEYFNQTNKTSQGTVVNAYYSPLLTNGRVYVWQTADSVNDFVRLSFQRQIEDVDSQANNLDIPTEWLETVIYGVAARLVDDYNVTPEKGNIVTAKAGALMETSLGWDQEYESINISPSFN